MTSKKLKLLSIGIAGLLWYWQCIFLALHYCVAPGRKLQSCIDRGWHLKNDKTTEIILSKTSSSYFSQGSATQDSSSTFYWLERIDFGMFTHDSFCKKFVSKICSPAWQVTVNITNHGLDTERKSRTTFVKLYAIRYIFFAFQNLCKGTHQSLGKNLRRASTADIIYEDSFYPLK